MDHLVEFIRARLDEDERWASQPAMKDWRYVSTHEVDSVVVDHVLDVGRAVVDVSSFDKGVLRPDEAAHAARHSPSRVLRDVEARKILLDVWSGAFQREDDYPGPDWDRVRAAGRMTVRLLAAPYAGHPDFREEWRS